MTATSGIPAAVPCQSLSQNRCGISHLAPHALQWVLLVCHGADECDVWALDALWKKQAWPEIFGFGKEHLDFAEEQVFEGLLSYPSCSLASAS